MARFDQYIGLTKDAINFIEKLKKEQNATIDKIILCPKDQSLGQHEDIIGSEISVLTKSPNKKYVYKEIIQMVPWSSGPMYFSCLRFFIHKECGQIIHVGDIFQWVLNPEVKEDEYDFERGHFFI